MVKRTDLPPHAATDTSQKLLTTEDGIDIPSAIQNYVAIISERGSIVIHVAESHRGNPSVASLLKYFEKRRLIYGPVTIVASTYDDIQTLIVRHKDAISTETVSFQRRAISLLQEAGDLGVSDFHLTQLHGGKAVINYRVDGDLIPSGHQMSVDDSRQLCNVLSAMADTTSSKGNYTDTFSRQAAIVANLAQYNLETSFSAVRLQFNPPVLGPEAAIRLQAAHQQARALAELGLPSHQVAMLIAMLHAPHGAILISGWTGSGKSNSAAAMIDYYTDTHPERRAVTVEDPVEVKLKRASQHQVNEDDPNKLAQRFAALIRQILRSDPDLLMVQEMRDAESAKATLEAAITGSLLISAVHSSTPSKIIRRLRGWNLDATSLADPSTLVGLIGVDLVKRLCSCRLPIRDVLTGNSDAPRLLQSVNRLQHHANHAYALRDELAPTIVDGFTRNIAGCEKCRDPKARIQRPAGMLGRAQIAEIIPTDADLLEHLVAGRFREAESYLRATLRIPSL